MRIQLAKWGNSLAVRLPAACVRAAGLREGDSVDAEMAPAGGIVLTPARSFDKRAFLDSVRQMRRKMKKSAAVVEKMRRETRY